MARMLPTASYWLIGPMGTSRIGPRLHPVAYRWLSRHARYQGRVSRRIAVVVPEPTGYAA